MCATVALLVAPDAYTLEPLDADWFCKCDFWLEYGVYPEKETAQGAAGHASRGQGQAVAAAFSACARMR
jgi:hypothetical protein